MVAPSTRGLENLGVSGGFVVCLDAEAEWFNIAEEQEPIGSPTWRWQDVSAQDAEAISMSDDAELMSEDLDSEVIPPEEDSEVMPSEPDAELMPPADGVDLLPLAEVFEVMLPPEASGSMVPQLSIKDHDIASETAWPIVDKPNTIEMSARVPTAACSSRQQQPQQLPQPSPPPSQAIHNEGPSKLELLNMLAVFKELSTSVNIMGCTMIICLLALLIVTPCSMVFEGDMLICKQLATSYKELSDASLATCQQDHAVQMAILEELREQTHRRFPKSVKEDAQESDTDDESSHHPDEVPTATGCPSPFAGSCARRHGEQGGDARRNLFARAKISPPMRGLSTASRGFTDDVRGRGAEHLGPHSQIQDFLHIWVRGLQWMEKAKQRKKLKEGTTFWSQVHMMNDALRDVREEFDETGENSLGQAIQAMCALVPREYMHKINCFIP